MCISCAKSTRLIRMKDPKTGGPMFTTFSVELACDKCKEEGKAANCVHMLHLVPAWQSSDKHERLHVIMQDRPDLIVSELRLPSHHPPQLNAACAWLHTCF